MIRIMGNSPAILDLYLKSNEALAKTKITPKLRGLITAAVSNLNGCTYTLSIAYALGRREGLTEDELTSAADLRSNDSKTAAALAFAASVTRKHGSVSALEVQNLREAGYSDEEIVEIIGLIALNIFRNYFNLIARTDLDFPPIVAKPPLETAELRCATHTAE